MANLIAGGAGPEHLRAKDAAASGVSGHAPRRKFLNSRRSEIDSGACGMLFQYGKARVQNRGKNFFFFFFFFFFQGQNNYIQIHKLH